MLNICMTADHELFFGQNTTSEEQVFIQPTYRLMELLEQFNIPLCLMTDVCSILRYRELHIESNYPDLMDEQLRHAIARGHDVQLHIHPHWLTSDYVDGKWNFDYKSYTLNSFGFDKSNPQCVQNIIAAGKKYLVDLLTPIECNYDCIAFRAGGWCIQPEKKLLEALIAANITIDTTVYYGGRDQNPIKYYDFRHVPHKANWWIDPQKGLNYAATRAKGKIFEVVIGSYYCLPLVGLKRLKYKKHRWRMRNKREISRGTSLDSLDKNRLELFSQKVQNFFLQPILFTFDAACFEQMIDLLDYYLKYFDTKDKDIYISVIGHPKTLTKSSLEEIRKFCISVTGEKGDRVRFIRLRDIPI